MMRIQHVHTPDTDLREMYEGLRDDPLGPVCRTDYFPEVFEDFATHLCSPNVLGYLCLESTRGTLIQGVGLIWFEDIRRDPKTRQPRHGVMHVYFPRRWRGHAPALWARLLPILRQEGMTDIYARVHPAHRGARHMLEHVGFVAIGVDPNYAPFGGQWVSMPRYWLNLEEYDASPRTA